MYGEGNHSADCHMGKSLKFLLQLLKLLLIKLIVLLLPEEVE